MEKKDLKASKDSQGFYIVEEFGRVVWDGFAANANEAKSLAMENANSEMIQDGKYWCDRDLEWR